MFFIDLDDRSNVFVYKIYLFLFIFFIQFILTIISMLITNQIDFNEAIELAVRDALIAVIAYDIYNDLIYNKFFLTYNSSQKIIILTLLIICFLTIIKLFELFVALN